MRRISLLLLLLMSAVIDFGATPRAQAPGAAAVQTSETPDVATIAKIKDEGMNRSQVMDHISWLSDVYGPRLTGGPGIMQASEWALKKFAEWGVSNAHRETFPFGKGWSLVRFSAHLAAPQVEPLIGFPGAWTPGTNGPIVADVVRVRIDNDADLEKYRGTLKGKIVLTQPAREVRMLEGPFILRMTDKDLEEAATVPPAAAGRGRAGAGRGRGGNAGAGEGRSAAQSFQQRVQQFYKEEGVVALFNRGSDFDVAGGGSDLSWRQQRPDGGTIFPSGSGSRGGDAGSGLPIVTLAVEHYNRMIRVLEKNLPVRVALDIETKFYDEPAEGNGFNVIAEIPGSDPVLRDEVVMIGAHFDSVAAGTGATDNATGSAAMMEALRTLKAVGAKPRRTIRIALWGGEEQGLLGSRAYVREHFGDADTMALKPAHEKLSVYFNSDNGTGRIRGIWLQGNSAVEPIFKQWMTQLTDLGVTAIGPRSVSSTDHSSFDAVGLPAFQFMVDRLEYNARTHHSNMDTVDRVQANDMIQHATVIAVFAYNAAMRDQKLPRKGGDTQR
jgi:carboxypeptidase Q